jgi:hypothetical protein
MKCENVSFVNLAIFGELKINRMEVCDWWGSSGDSIPLELGKEVSFDFSRRGQKLIKASPSTHCTSSDFNLEQKAPEEKEAEDEEVPAATLSTSTSSPNPDPSTPEESNGLKSRGPTPMYSKPAPEFIVVTTKKKLKGFESYLRDVVNI